MYARITTAKINKDKLDGAGKLYIEKVIPEAKKQKGYKGLLVLGNQETGKGITITLWDNEEDAIANEQSGYYREQLAKFRGLYSDQPLIEGYEVVAKD